MVLSKEYQIALATAMGLPLDRCQRVSVDVVSEKSIQVTATFSVTSGQLAEAAKAVKDDG